MERSWITTTIGAQVLLQRGFDITKAQQRSGPVPVVSSGGVSSYHDTPISKGPGVVLGRKGTLGSVFYLDQDYWPHDTTLWVKDFKGNLPRFVYYFFRSMSAELLALDNATANPALNRNHVHPIEVLWPSRGTQESIANVLGVLDDKIASNRDVNAALEAFSSALFNSWFSDFDPVAVKRDGKTPIGVPAEAIDLFPSHFEESEVGSIPQGWRPSTIGAEVTVVGGSTPSTNESRFWNGDVCWVTPRDLSRLDDPVVLDTERHITQEGLGQISSGLLPVGTVLLSSRAPIGYIAVAEVPVAINQGFIAMKCDKQLSSHFVVNWVRENLDEVLSRAGGTTFAEISKAAFRPIPLVVPPPELLEAFDAIVAPLDALRVANVRESRKLAELRDTLLGPLLSGELTIRSAESAVAAAL
jgi:type I restriction enzyme S subunit